MLLYIGFCKTTYNDKLKILLELRTVYYWRGVLTVGRRMAPLHIDKLKGSLGQMFVMAADILSTGNKDIKASISLTSSGSGTFICLHASCLCPVFTSCPKYTPANLVPYREGGSIDLSFVRRMSECLFLSRSLFMNSVQRSVYISIYLAEIIFKNKLLQKDDQNHSSQIWEKVYGF